MEFFDKFFTHMDQELQYSPLVTQAKLQSLDKAAVIEKIQSMINKPRHILSMQF
jgi:hypothetical protein